MVLVLQRHNMVKIRKITSSILLMFIVTACLMEEDAKLSTPRQDYLGSQLRLNGYYYYYINGNTKYFDTFFLYRNGVLLHTGADDTGDLLKFESRLIGTNPNIWRNGSKMHWGVFLIEGLVIKFEKWYCAEGVCKAYGRLGEIVNDSTFIMKESYRMDQGKKARVIDINEVYHFREFSPKPDSTNNYIK